MRKGIAKPNILTAKKETEVKSAVIHQGLLCTEGREAPALCVRGEAGSHCDGHVGFTWETGRRPVVDGKAKAKVWVIGMFHVNEPVKWRKLGRSQGRDCF